MLTISIPIGQEPPAYFENSRDFVDKHDYSIIWYPITSADYTVLSAQCASLTKEREHLIDYEWFRVMRPLNAFVFVFLQAQIKSACISHNSFFYIFHKTMYNKTIIEFGFCDIRNTKTSSDY